MVVRPLDARDPGKMVNLALMRVTNATDFTFSYPDYEVYRDSAHSFSGVIAVKFERLRLTNAGGIVSKRTYAAELPALAWISGKNREPFTCLAAPNLPRTPDGPTGPVNTEDSYALLGNNYSSQGLRSDPTAISTNRSLSHKRVRRKFQEFEADAGRRLHAADARVG
jgi:hypothetical protein